MKHIIASLYGLATIAASLLLPMPIHAGSPSPFALVMIDEASEAKLGRFPVDRGVIAKGIEQLAAAGVRGVVLKFFYDQPSNSASDAALASAIDKTKVILQARIQEDEAKPNKLPDRFAVNVPVGSAAVSGKAGWIPLPAFSNRAHGVGFVDILAVDRVPAFEQLGDRSYPSLTTAAISLALGDAPLSIQPGKQLRFGDKSLALDAKSQIALSPKAFRDANSTAYLSFADVIEGKVSLAALRGKIVVLGYHGSQMPTIRTSVGEVKLHLAFWLGLNDVWQQLQ